MPVTRHQALDYHFGTCPGKIEVTPTKPCRTQHDLSLAYTPGAEGHLSTHPMPLRHLNSEASSLGPAQQ
jgi:malic enzyme